MNLVTERWLRDTRDAQELTAFAVLLVHAARFANRDDAVEAVRSAFNAHEPHTFRDVADLLELVATTARGASA